MNILAEWAEKAKVGGKVIINSVEYAIEEIIAYHCDAEKWVNIVVHDAAGRELAVEAVEGEDELTLWRQSSFYDDYFDEQDFRLEEKGRAQTIVETAEGTENASTPYKVYRHKVDGQRVAVETWDRKKCYYAADVTAPEFSF